MFSFFKKQKWAHVKTISGGGLTYAIGTPHEKKDGKIHIHLYESDKGNRKYEAVCSFTEVTPEKIDAYIKTTDTYNTKLVRWLAGRYDPEIPRYSQINEEDTANALRGKVE